MTRTTSHSAREAGATIVEVLVAMGLAAVCLASVGTLVDAGIRAAADARDQSVALLLARQRLESVRTGAGCESGSGPHSGPLEVNTTGCFDVVDTAGTAVDVGRGHHASGVFLRRWAMTPVAVGGQRLDRVVVRVLRVGAASTSTPALVSVRLSTMRVAR